jgi:hypothetical protein
MKAINLTRLEQLEQETCPTTILLRVVYAPEAPGLPETEGPTYRYMVPPDGLPYREDDHDES